MSKQPVDGDVVDQLRARWQQAISDLGSIAAAEDGAAAFVLRSGCSLEQGRVYVARAWHMLGIK